MGEFQNPGERREATNRSPDVSADVVPHPEVNADAAENPLGNQSIAHPEITRTAITSVKPDSAETFEPRPPKSHADFDAPDSLPVPYDCLATIRDLERNLRDPSQELEEGASALNAAISALPGQQPLPQVIQELQSFLRDMPQEIAGAHARLRSVEENGAKVGALLNDAAVGEEQLRKILANICQRIRVETNYFAGLSETGTDVSLESAFTARNPFSRYDFVNPEERIKFSRGGFIRLTSGEEDFSSGYGEHTNFLGDLTIVKGRQPSARSICECLSRGVVPTATLVLHHELVHARQEGPDTRGYWTGKAGTLATVLSVPVGIALAVTNPLALAIPVLTFFGTKVLPMVLHGAAKEHAKVCLMEAHAYTATSLLPATFGSSIAAKGIRNNVDDVLNASHSIQRQLGVDLLALDGVQNAVRTLTALKLLGVKDTEIVRLLEKCGSTRDGSPTIEPLEKKLSEVRASKGLSDDTLFDTVLPVMVARNKLEAIFDASRVAKISTDELLSAYSEKR
jgi:hypothetical protein